MNAEQPALPDLVLPSPNPAAAAGDSAAETTCPDALGRKVMREHQPPPSSPKKRECWMEILAKSKAEPRGQAAHGGGALTPGGRRADCGDGLLEGITAGVDGRTRLREVAPEAGGTESRIGEAPDEGAPGEGQAEQAELSGVGIVLRQFSDASGKGFLVVKRLAAGSPAALCGAVHVRDVLLSVDGCAVSTREEAARLVLGVCVLFVCLSWG